MGTHAVKLLLALVFSLSLHAACTTDAKGVCLPPANASIAQLIGPVAPLTATDVSYYTITVPLVIDNLVASALANPPTLGAAIMGSGTCTYTDAPSALFCPGGNFTTFTCRTCGSPITQLIVAWNTVDGAGTGRYLDTVETIIDNTHLLFTTFQTLASPGTNLSVYFAGAESSTYQHVFWQQQPGNYSDSWNYYGVCDAIYRHYVYTADATWLTKFRSWSDIIWQWSSDHGRVWSGQKDVDWMCMFLRALDGHPERMASLYPTAQFALSQDLEDATNYGRTVVQDTRERGYMTAGLVEGAIADTTANGGSDVHHAWYCARLGEQITGWITHQETSGMMDEPIAQWVQGFPYSGKTNAPWRSNVWIKAWQMAYVLFMDTTSAGCNNTTLAALLLPAIQKAVDWDYGWGVSKLALGGNGYSHYAVGSPSRGQDCCGDYVTGTGTIAFTLTSTAIVGTGTSFIAQGLNSGTRFVASTDPLTYHYKSIYKVDSCSNETHCVLSQAFGTFSEPSSTTVSTFLVTEPSPAGTGGCASSADFCEVTDQTPPKGDPNSIRDYSAQQAWMYHYCGLLVPVPGDCSKYKAYALELFARTYRGPSDGPYGTGVCAGTAGLLGGCYGGGTVDENGVSCGAGFTCRDGLAGSLSVPCGNGCGNGPFSALGKDFGQAAGFMCGGACTLALTLMDPITVSPSRLIIKGHPVVTGRVVIQ